MSDKTHSFKEIHEETERIFLSREDEVCNMVAEILRPLIGKSVTIYWDGWSGHRMANPRAAQAYNKGTLTSVSKRFARMESK